MRRPQTSGKAETSPEQLNYRSFQAACNAFFADPAREARGGLVVPRGDQGRASISALFKGSRTKDSAQTDHFAIDCDDLEDSEEEII